MNRVLLHALDCDQIRVEFAPEFGGALANVTFRGVPVLRPWNGEPCIRRMAVYPLLPSPRRAADAGSAGGTPGSRSSFGDHPNSLQRTGWQRAWRFETHGHKARMRLRHRPDENGTGDWPFALDAEQVISLREDGVALLLKVDNLAAEAVSVGLGWHAFFPRHDGAYVTFRTQATCAHEAGAPANRCSQGPDPGGTADIVWPRQRLALEMGTSSELGDFVAMMPPSPADFFALEPAATKSAATTPASQPSGFRILPPGESLSVLMTLRVRELT